MPDSRNSFRPLDGAVLNLGIRLKFFKRNQERNQDLKRLKKQSTGSMFGTAPVGNRRERFWPSRSNPALCAMTSLRQMRARFRTRFKLPFIADGGEWAVMWNRISCEEAEIADQVWEGLNKENQEILRHSQVVPDLLRILVDSRDKKTWTQNPLLPMISYAYMIMMLQPPNWSDHFEKIQNWIIDFELHALEPKVTEQDYQTRMNFLSDKTELIRKLRKEHGQID
jgi:hypothetical protein